MVAKVWGGWKKLARPANLILKAGKRGRGSKEEQNKQITDEEDIVEVE